MLFVVIVIDVAFFALLAAGLYLEKLSWDGAFVFALVWLGLLFAFKWFGWIWAFRSLLMLILDLVLSQLVFDSDDVLPNWWFRRT